MAPPTAMAMIAILLNLFLELRFTDGIRVEAGEGVDGIVEHNFRGGPHKPEFPSNDELG
jgi:hypothetical protein